VVPLLLPLLLAPLLLVVPLEEPSEAKELVLLPPQALSASAANATGIPKFRIVFT
jgi:hypothetical protein